MDGYHHAWGRTLKDINLRFRALNGERSSYQAGFDTQGLWVEVQVEKELGLNGKKEILDLGIGEFNDLCRARVEKYSAVQTQQSQRLGQWMNWSNSYYTHTDTNIEGIWKFLNRVAQNGWLYKDFRSMPWCTRCETSLSEHEMAGSVQKLTHRSVTVKSHIPELRADILVWTTTPWTLPANTALAVSADNKYALFNLPGHERPLIADVDFVSSLTAKPQVQRVFPGSELENLRYEPLYELDSKHKAKDLKIVTWDEVTAGDGTGVVHIAPGCGPQDFQLGKDKELETIIPINDKGIYLQGFHHLSGKHIKEASASVISDLEKTDKLFASFDYEHSCPCCWRCKEEVVFRPVSEWFISTDQVRQELIEAADAVTWLPEHMGLRMKDWLTQMSDWCISRKRFWGLPLPIYECGNCQTVTVVDSKESLKDIAFDKAKASELKDLHRPYIDEISISCPCCRERVERVSEVGDCWLDAGITPFTTEAAFQNWQTKEGWQAVDYIVEMSEQIRLWFYSQLFMSVVLTGTAPYKTVQTHERVLNEDGIRFSKTGIMIEFGDAVERMGADTMRMLFAKQSPTNDIRFGYKLGDFARRPLLTLMNIASFFDTYAEIDKPLLNPAPPETLRQTDRWLQARLNAFVSKAYSSLNQYNSPEFCQAFEGFIEDLSNWYIRINRRRFWKSDNDADKESAYYSLFHSLKTTLTVLSPVAPFLTESLWQKIVRKYDLASEESVHLTTWPEAADLDYSILDSTAKVRSIIAESLNLRSKAKIKIRQPLQELHILSGKETLESCRVLEGIIKEELNVRSVLYPESLAGMFENQISLDVRAAGKILRGDLNRVKELVQNLSAEGRKQAAMQIEAGDDVLLSGLEYPINPSIFKLEKVACAGYITAELPDFTLILKVELTPDLIREGWLREVTRHVQVLRKGADLNIQDRIKLTILAPENVETAIKERAEYIRHEALAEVGFGEVPGDSLITKTINIDGEPVTLSISK